MKTNKFDELFNTIMESEGYDSADELEPFESDYIPTDEQIRKEVMTQLCYEDIPYSEAKMLANDIVAMLTGQPFSSKSEFEQNVSFEIRENLRAIYESKKVDKSNPKTGDNIELYFILLGIGLLVIIQLITSSMVRIEQSMENNY